MTSPLRRFLPYGRQQIGEDDVAAVAQVLRGAHLTTGPKVADFEQALGQATGAAHAVVCSSGTAALHLAAMALDMGPDDKVVVPALTFLATANVVRMVGAEVVFADVDPTTLNLDPTSVRERITGRTRAIIPVHFAGLAADIDAFDAITNDTGVPVIYDAAHAVGAKYGGRGIGGAGRASCYSFQSNKNMTCLGEGGAVTSDSEPFAEIVRQKKTFGYVYGAQLRVATVGFNYRMTKVQYAVGLSQLQKIDRVIGARQERMVRMGELLGDVDELILPAGHGPDHGSHLYVVRLDTGRVSFSRDELRTHLKAEHGVGTVVHYPALWTWDAFIELGHTEKNANCPVAARASTQVLSLPIFPRTTEEELAYVAWALKQSLSDLG